MEEQPKRAGTVDDPFAVLGVDEQTDDATLRQAYLDRVRQHPPETDPENFERVRDAYNAIDSEEKRNRWRLLSPRPLEGIAELERRLRTELRRVGPKPWIEVIRHGLRRPGGGSSEGSDG